MDVLTETDYSEHEISESPTFGPDVDETWRMSGSHTFDPWWTGDRWLCVVDGVDSPNWVVKPRNWTIGIMESRIPSKYSRAGSCAQIRNPADCLFEYVWSLYNSMVEYLLHR